MYAISAIGWPHSAAAPGRGMSSHMRRATAWGPRTGLPGALEWDLCPGSPVGPRLGEGGGGGALRMTQRALLRRRRVVCLWSPDKWGGGGAPRPRSAECGIPSEGHRGAAAAPGEHRGHNPPPPPLNTPSPPPPKSPGDRQQSPFLPEPPGQCTTRIPQPPHLWGLIARPPPPAHFQYVGNPFEVMRTLFVCSLAHLPPPVSVCVCACVCVFMCFASVCSCNGMYPLRRTERRPGLLCIS